MVAIVGMGMVMDPAGPVIPEMGRDNKGDREEDHPDMLPGEPLFRAKKEKANAEQQQRGKTVVMASVTMPERIHADEQCEDYHQDLQGWIVRPLPTQDRKTIDQQGKNGTVYGTGYGSRYP
jgi:hypothetical protein